MRLGDPARDFAPPHAASHRDRPADVPSGASTALTFIDSTEARSRRFARSSSSVVFQLWNFIFAFGFIYSSLSFIAQCCSDVFLRNSYACG